MKLTRLRVLGNTKINPSYSKRFNKEQSGALFDMACSEFNIIYNLFCTRPFRPLYTSLSHMQCFVYYDGSGNNIFAL